MQYLMQVSPYSFPAVLVCAFGGIPGAIIVILLHMSGIAF